MDTCVTYLFIFPIRKSKTRRTPPCTSDASYLQREIFRSVCRRRTVKCFLPAAAPPPPSYLPRTLTAHARPIRVHITTIRIHKKRITRVRVFKINSCYYFLKTRRPGCCSSWRARSLWGFRALRQNRSNEFSITVHSNAYASAVCGKVFSDCSTAAGLSDGRRRRHAETARETRHGLVAVLFFVSRRSVLLSRSPPASREFIRFESLLRYRVFYAFHLCRDRTALKKYGRAVIIRERISNRVSQSVCVPQSMPWREPITLLVINLNLRLKRPFFYLSP